MSVIRTIRDAIRSYEGSMEPQRRDMLAQKIRILGRNLPAAAPWAEAFEICVAYNAEQERAAAAWLEELRLEVPDEVSLCNERREAMRVAIIGASNCRTFAELDAMTPAERFADGIVPKWLQRAWSGTEPAGGARTRLDRELA